MFRKTLIFIAVLWLVAAYVLIYRSVNYDDYRFEGRWTSIWFSESAKNLNFAGYPVFRVCTYRPVLTLQIKIAGSFTIISLPPPLPTVLDILLASIPAIVVVMFPIRRFWRSIDQTEGQPIARSSALNVPTLQRHVNPASDPTQPLILEYAPPTPRMGLSISSKWQLAIAIWAAAFIVFILKQIILTPFD